MTNPAPPEKDNKGKPRPLRRRFKLAVAGALGATALAAGGAFAIFGTATGNIPLTTEEAAIAQSLFGPDFRTDDIRKQYVQSWFGGIIQYPAAMVPLSRQHIYFFQPELRMDDLTMSSNDNFNLYMHEMTHIWQHRGNWAPICKTYDYELTPNSRFSQFCNEQQASIVGDYAENFLNPRNIDAIRLLGDRSSTRAGNEYLMRVVESQFPHARQSRYRIEARNREVYRCTLRFSVTFNSQSGIPSEEDGAAIRQCLENPAAQPAPPTPDTATPQDPQTPTDVIVNAAQRFWPRRPS